MTALETWIDLVVILVAIAFLSTRMAQSSGITTKTGEK
jgi:hypothetical protein